MVQGWRRLVALVGVLLVSACGGGGGGDGAASGNSLSLDRSGVQLLLGTADRDVSQVVVTVGFRGAGVVVGTLPGQAVPPWLQVSAGTPAGGTVRVTVGAFDPGLQPGTYTTTLRFVTGNADQTGLVSQDLPVTLKVAPRVEPASWTLDAVAGGAPRAQTLAIDTPNGWTLRADQPWVTFERTQGTGSAAVAVSVAPSQLAVGEHSAQVTLEDTASGATQVLPLRVTVDPRRLLVRQPAVALGLTANRSTLGGSIAVADTGDGVTGWTATADQPWLRLGAASGQTPAVVAVNADASGLADGLHHARVTLVPAGTAGVTNPVVVRVALRIDRSLTVQPTVALPVNEGACAGPRLTDPLRHRLVLGCGSTLTLRDFDSGAEVGSLELPGASISGLAVSGDGSTLYAVDAAQGRIARVDLDGFSAATPITGVRASYSTTLVWTEVQGVPMLATSELELFHAGTGLRLADAAPLYGSTCCGLRLAVRRDGRALYATNGTQGNHDLMRFALAWRNGALQVRRTHLISEPGTGHDLALDPTDGAMVSAVGTTTVIGGTLAGALLRDPDTLALRGTFALTSGQGARRVVGFAGGLTWLLVANTVVGHDAAGQAVASLALGDFLTEARLSPDGSRLMLLGSSAANGVVRFVDRP